jgi:hypothetical protein
MKLVAKVVTTVQLLVGALLFSNSAHAVSVQELEKLPSLTPQNFANYFADFEFKFHEEVQDYNTFLSTKSGDCDDYGTVASEVLGHFGYTPRLIAIRMKGETHVVCYINEAKGYLDYNCRKDAEKIVPCSPKITEIAKSVAKSFDRDWVATYEFTYSSGEHVKRLVNQIVSNNHSNTTGVLAVSAGGRQK